jgi:hypothetical protein
MPTAAVGSSSETGMCGTTSRRSARAIGSIVVLVPTNTTPAGASRRGTQRRRTRAKITANPDAYTRDTTMRFFPVRFAS